MSQASRPWWTQGAGKTPAHSPTTEQTTRLGADAREQGTGDSLLSSQSPESWRKQLGREAHTSLWWVRTHSGLCGKETQPQVLRASEHSRGTPPPP